MEKGYKPTNQEIREAFENELAAVGGAVSDAFDDGSHLFLRSILPASTDVRPGDRVRAGIALRASGRQVLVHPYTFRQVCSNGAILAQAVQTRRIERVEEPDLPWIAAERLEEVREAVRVCAAPEAFITASQQMRTAAELEADQVIMAMTFQITHSPRHIASGLVTQILSRFSDDRDRSAFGLMNAITATARDTRDPDLRWRLEELGGGVLDRLSKAPVPDDEELAELIA